MADSGMLTVVEARAFQQRWIVRFAEIQDRDAAECLRGQVLRAEPIVDADELWVHELIGMMVCEVDGTERGGSWRCRRIRPAIYWLWSPVIWFRSPLWSSSLEIDWLWMCPTGCSKRTDRRQLRGRRAYRCVHHFPVDVEMFLDYGVIGRAVEQGRLVVQIHDLRAGAGDPHRSVDDAPFGGGAGMVMMPSPCSIQ